MKEKTVLATFLLWHPIFDDDDHCKGFVAGRMNGRFTEFQCPKILPTVERPELDFVIKGA